MEYKATVVLLSKDRSIDLEKPVPEAKLFKSSFIKDPYGNRAILLIWECPPEVKSSIAILEVVGYNEARKVVPEKNDSNEVTNLVVVESSTVASIDVKTQHGKIINIPVNERLLDEILGVEKSA